MAMEQGMEQHTSNAVASNCLTVADKRPHRPGGCVGIFFQLFDWNRRFAKKKLFSTKLLPPARMKQASKKFAGDETMPKTKPLIADENSGGFPANAKKNSSNRSLAEFQKPEMRSPSLVARLMGLDSMPAVQRDKHKKPSKSDPLANLSSDKVSTKPESRPPKLQKTGQCDQRAVVTPRLGAEALHIRSVLSRSRKHGNPPAKLATPVKSPKLSSARHASRTSRLIDAATRILEPGIQATNRAKSTIAYSNSKRYAPNDDALGGIFGQSVKEVQKSSSVTSCKNCGNVVDVVVQSRMEEEPFHYRATSLASHFATPYTDQGRDVACKRKQGQQISSDVEMQDKGRACSSEVVADRKDMLHEFGAKGQSKGFQHGYSHRTDDETSAAVDFKQRSQGQNRMPVVGSDRLTQASKLSSFSGTKDFVAMNRSLSGRSRVRVLNRMDNPTFNMERRFCNRRDDVLPQLRSPGVKRKTVSARAQLQSNGHGTSIPPVRQRSINFDAVNEKKIGLNPFRARTRFDSQSESSIPNKGNIDLASFTFSSQSRVRTGYDSRNPMGKNSSNRRNMVVGESEGKGCVQKQVSPRRDALGSLLQQKLKELISQEEDELKGGNALPIRSTAMILQELISALTIETVIPTSPPSSFSIANAPFQNGKHYLSPGSVLDASLSNESCFSSSLDDNSASSMLTWDSTTTSTTEGRRFSKLVTDLHDHISRMLQSITLAGGCQLTSRDLGHAKETILTAELLFGAANHHGPDRTRSSVLGSFLLDELSAVAVSMGSKEASNQLRRLLFDCVMEWLDSRCSRYCDTGFRTWRQQQLLVPWCKETVMEEVGEEVKRWTNMAGLIPDEMVELEMGPSLAKWTEFEVESYEIGGDIGCEIVDVLLEETMRDLWEL